MSLLSRLSLLQKFAVLALVGLFVAAWPTYLHVRDALRTIERLPCAWIVRTYVTMCSLKRSAQPMHTVPTGVRCVPPVGPATPVTATASVESGQRASAPLAMA